MSPNDAPLTTLLRELVIEIAELIRQELRLARAETAEKLGRAQHAMIALAAGLLLAFCALLILLQALVVALAEVMPPWAASLLVGGAVAVAAFVLLRHAQKAMSPANLVPERTLDSLRQDREMVMEKAP